MCACDKSASLVAKCHVANIALPYGHGSVTCIIMQLLNIQRVGMFDHDLGRIQPRRDGKNKTRQGQFVAEGPPSRTLECAIAANKRYKLTTLPTTASNKTPQAHVGSSQRNIKKHVPASGGGGGGANKLK
jgi:hypothetical protein